MFIIVRHGNTFEADEQPRRIGARTDLPLTAKGVEQARALGRYFTLGGWHFSRVLVSPLLRTRQTAEAILAEQPKPPAVQHADFLREVDHGPDEDKVEEDILARIGRSALDAWETSAAVPPGWIVDPDTRLTAWKELFAGEDHAQGPTLLVTSNGAARFALLADPALQQAAASLPSLKLPTGGFGVIGQDGSGGPTLAAWGLRP
jgi:broad specificity phosphatase PhoE